LVFVTNGDFGITALDATTGTVKWKVGDSANSPDGSKQTILNDILYTITYSTGSVMAMDTKTGARKWITKQDPKGGTQGWPIGADDIIYTVAGDGTCYALDAVTGTVKWSAPKFSFSDDNPIVANNLVYSYRGVIDAKTGTSKLTFPSISSFGGLALWINGKAYHPSTSGDIQ
jgi:outer membrane protein assembly factor BamB